METLNETTNTPQAKQLLNIEEVKAITGFSTTTIYKLMHKGEFPQAKKCGRSTHWRLADIEDYVAN